MAAEAIGQSSITDKLKPLRLELCEIGRMLWNLRAFVNMLTVCRSPRQFVNRNLMHTDDKMLSDAHNRRPNSAKQSTHLSEGRTLI